MDMKYAVLLMVEPATFMARFELALIAHGVVYCKDSLDYMDSVGNAIEFIKEKFLKDGSRHGEELMIKEVPFKSVVGAASYYIVYNESGKVVGLYRMEFNRYGPMDFKTDIVAISVTSHLKPYSEINYFELKGKQGGHIT